MVWQLDEAQLLKRWELHNKFDPLSRLFGGEESRKPKTQKLNPAALEARLLKMFPEGE